MKKFTLIISFVGYFLYASISLAQDLTHIAGDFTSSVEGRNAIQTIPPGINRTTEEETIHNLGFGVFHSQFTRKTGLGPTFINSSCGGCHLNNGRGLIGSFEKFKPTTYVIKVSRPRLNFDGSNRDVRGLGNQLRNKSTRKNYDKIKINLRWKKVLGSYLDGTTYELRKPLLKVFVKGLTPRRVVYSIRMTPHVIGMGLLEAISDDTLLALSDPFDNNNDGISGKVNYVPDVRKGQKVIGRFGFKATQPTVEQQSAGALFSDMRITNTLFSGRDPDKAVELSEEALFSLARYQILGGVPAARNQNDPNVLAGKELFKKINCDSCHTMTITTGTHSDYRLNNQEIHPFTDLLLHDMGPDLADERADYDAIGAEWKTPALWGLGYYKEISEKNAPIFMHDGRARSIEEAILWHGGESELSKQLFKNLTKAEREQLLAFLNSI